MATAKKKSSSGSGISANPFAGCFGVIILIAAVTIVVSQIIL